MYHKSHIQYRLINESGKNRNISELFFFQRVKRRQYDQILYYVAQAYSIVDCEIFS